jgi:hypothetical protein
MEDRGMRINNCTYNNQETELNNFFVFMIANNSFVAESIRHEEEGKFRYTFKDDILEVLLHNIYGEWQLFIDKIDLWETEGKCPIYSWGLPKNQEGSDELVKAMNYIIDNDWFSNGYNKFKPNSFDKIE